MRMLREQNTDSGGTDWIEGLRRHSWEMELLLAGFVLVGLLQIPAYLHDLEALGWMNVQGGQVVKSLTVTLPIRILLVGTRIMTINLGLLLLLRGFWIGIIGLSSAFPKGIDHENLAFSKRFSAALHKRSMDTESLIVRLDDICSSVFALSFLVFFLAISMGLYGLEISLLSLVNSIAIDEVAAGNKSYLVLAGLSAAAIWFFLLAGVLKIIDFLSTGLFKRIKNRWFAGFFAFISAFVSFATLGFLYRPIYYILVSNASKKAIALTLMIYVALAFGILFGFEYNAHTYFAERYISTWDGAKHALNAREYENLRSHGHRVIDGPLIQSDVIRGDYVRLFIPYDADDNDDLAEHCPELETVSPSFELMFGTHVVDLPKIEESLRCFADFYTVSLDDSLNLDLEFLFMNHPNRQEPGVVTYIPVAGLEPGRHSIKLAEPGNKVNWIPFWKEEG